MTFYQQKKYLRELKEYLPAKSVEEMTKEFSLQEKDLIKLKLYDNLYWPSSYGPSPKVKKTIIKNLEKIHIYPTNQDLADLQKAISNYLKIPIKNIVTGAGVDGILDTLLKIVLGKNNQVIIPVPTYEMYDFIVRINGGIPKFLQRDENFEVPLSGLLSAINKKVKLIILCSPNHPTGNAIKQNQLEKIIKKTKAFVVIDEAFAEFANRSVVNLVKKYKNLIVLRTFSKAFGLAGLRIGYGVMSKDIAKDFNKTRLPFSINSLGLKVAITALEDQKHLQKVVKLIKEGREYIRRNIKFKTYSSQANFVLVNVSPLKAKKVIGELLKEGVLVRDCSLFERLRENFIRIKIGKTWQNRAIVKAINKIYANFSKN